MKAISLWEPWATLIAIGAKKIETRSWRFPGVLPCRIAIHAAKRFTTEQKRLCEQEPFYSLLAGHALWTGCVVATARLIECRPTSDQDLLFHPAAWADQLSEQEKALGDFSPGRYGWILKDVERILPAVPARGAQGIWEFDSGTVRV